MKIYTTLGYIVSLILLNLGHVFRFCIVSRMCVTHTADESETQATQARRGWTIEDPREGTASQDDREKKKRHRRKIKMYNDGHSKGKKKVQWNETRKNE